MDRALGGAASVRDRGDPFASLEVLPSTGPARRRTTKSGAGRRRATPEGRSSCVSDRIASDPERFRTSDDRRLGRVASCRYGLGWSEPRTCRSWLVPLDSRAKGQGHGRQKRHGHSEARQVRLHNTTSMGRNTATTPATGRSSGGRSLALRPHLAMGLPWTVTVTKRTSLLSRTVRDVRHGSHTPEVPIRPARRVSAATHRPCRPGPRRGPGNEEGAARGPLLRESLRVGGDPFGLSPSGARQEGRVARSHRAGPSWHQRARNPSMPLEASRQRESHGRQERHGHGEARQVRLHDTTSFGCATSDGPRQPGGLPSWKIPGFASPSRDGFALDGGHHEANIASCHTVSLASEAGHASVVPVGRGCRVSAAAHRGDAGSAPRTHHVGSSSRCAGAGTIRRACLPRRRRVGSQAARGRASRRRSRSRRRRRSAHRRC